ncbi:aldo/keto reductase [Candidatus Saccharibacteria bacterium]|nr:aldo/keto reductase [Candidatus Saccharibacteria bacterium]
MESLTLKDKKEIPILGFGTWPLRGSLCTKALRTALEVGYRHIDTADYYRNHRDIAKALEGSGVPREELFIVTKLMPPRLGREDVLAAGKRFLEELGTEYLDLLLIHWPTASVPLEETLGAMHELMEAGVTKSLGVSNFTIEDTRKALETGFEVVNNQVEFHPRLKPADLREFCEQNDVVVTAYSPLDKGRSLELSLVKELSEKYQKPASQVVLNWVMQKGMVAIPASSNPEHIEENFDSLEWKLEEEDIARVDAI